MKPKFRVILNQAIEEGVLLGYRRAFKHNEDPSEEVICETIEECVMSQIYEYFTFDEEDYQ
jgi:predicted Zn-dependent protease with MMP-like domain